MSATVPTQNITVTKNSVTGNFDFVCQGPSGGIRYAFALLSADMATAAALGSGASATLTYGQDGVSPAGPGKADFPQNYTQH
jgi:hypothetical protein